MRPVICAIDPGASGALAFFSPVAGTLEIIDMPTVEVKRGAKMKNEISPQMLAPLINARKPGVAVLEKVGAMPGQGSSSMFQFGRGVGMVEGIVAALQIPIEYVTPQAWQKAAVGLHQPCRLLEPLARCALALIGVPPERCHRPPPAVPAPRRVEPMARCLCRRAGAPPAITRARE